MSGLKQSTIALKREQKARHKAFNAIARAERSSKGIQKSIFSLLAKLPDGVKDSFPKEVDAATQWVHQNLPAYRIDMGSAALGSLIDTYRAHVDRGQRILAGIVEVQESKRDEKATSFVKCTSALYALLDGHRATLDRWRPNFCARVEQQLESFSEGIRCGDFVVVEAGLAQLADQLSDSCAEVAEFERQDNERNYIVEAVAEVCHEMGWKVMGSAVLEDENDLTSALLLSVDTHTNGTLEFRMTLESLSVHSPLTAHNDVCFKDFDTISRSLQHLGIVTKFEQVTIQEEPIGRVHREQDPPDVGNEFEMVH